MLEQVAQTKIMLQPLVEILLAMVIHRQAAAKVIGTLQVVQVVRVQAQARVNQLAQETQDHTHRSKVMQEVSVQLME
jgi:hypothetical protein